jgi:hypothetical protein
MLAPPWGENECNQSEKPGVAAFAQFVKKHQGGSIGRIVGPCGVKSGHASGRAWDWMISALDPESRARADELIAWLLANDAEMFRRAGLRYIIWDKKVFSSVFPSWRKYDGFSDQGTCPSPPCRNPHTNHVHFSFSKEGAAGETSFYQWLRGETEPPDPALPGPDPVPLSKPAGLGWIGVGLVFGFGTVMAYNRRQR